MYRGKTTIAQAGKAAAFACEMAEQRPQADMYADNTKIPKQSWK